MSAQETIDRWHEMVASRDLSKLGDFLHEDALFRSPMAHTPYPGKFAVYFALSNVIEVFEDFTYHREFIADDDLSLIHI